MINQTRSHCRSSLLPSSTIFRLPQAAMHVVKVISNCADKAHPVVKSCPPRKAKRFSSLATVSHSISEVESLYCARVGLGPSQLSYYSLELVFAEYWANLYRLNFSLLAMLDHLCIDQFVRHSQDCRVRTTPATTMCNSIAMTKHRNYRVLVSWLPISEDGWFATIDSKPRSGVFDRLMNHLSRALACNEC